MTTFLNSLNTRVLTSGDLQLATPAPILSLSNLTRLFALVHRYVVVYAGQIDVGQCTK